MKRIELTAEQLEQVVKYRQAGMSFLKIEESMKGSGISRRTARRAFREWEKKRSVQELETVRAMAGKDEQRIHMDSVTTFATDFVNKLDIPEALDFDEDAETFIESLMATGTVTMPWEEKSPATDGKTKRRNSRRNKLLLESLKTHTADIVDWDMLQTWKSGYDTCRAELQAYKSMVAGVIRDVFTPFPEPEHWIRSNNTEEKIRETLKDEIKKVVWKGMVDGGIDAALDLIVTREAGENVSPQVIVGDQPFVQISGEELHMTFFERCQDAVELAWNSEEAERMRYGIDMMRNAITEFEDKLEPLNLRPLLLGTKCRICPVP